MGLCRLTRHAGELISPDDPRWLQLVSRLPADIYHQPRYLQLASAVEEGDLRIAWVKAADREAGVPILLRDLPQGQPGRDAASPYGYPCVISDAQAPDEWEAVWGGLQGLLAEQGIAAAFLRFHPLLSTRACLQTAGELGLILRHGPTVHIDLTQSEEALWSETRPRLRSNINQLRRAGWQFRPDDWSLLPQFILLYEETMARAGAASFYFFPQSYYQALGREMGDAANLHGILAPDGTLASAGIFFRWGAMVQYHLGGTAHHHLAAGPAKLLFHEVRQWYRDAGAQVLHLGGGLGGQCDSLYRFKAGFSKKSSDFYTLRAVIDPIRYRKLTAQWERASGRASASLAEYFPAYRAPLEADRI